MLPSKVSDHSELQLNIQSVPRSKHTHYPL
jgi:hypothetical protein